MSLSDFLKGKPSEQKQAEATARQRHEDILSALHRGEVPQSIQQRARETAEGRLPWVATLTPAELRAARSHGLRPIATVSATCWLHYGYSWTRGHQQGWEAALQRLAAEACAYGANAVLDVKMRTVPLSVENSMDFNLVGTAVKIDGLPPSSNPVIATVPALEFVKLLEADVVPTGLAVGADYTWMRDWNGVADSPNGAWFNAEAQQLSQLWRNIRDSAHNNLRANAQGRGNGVLAHVNFSQMFEFEHEDKENERTIKDYLARHIVIATTLDARRGTPLPHNVKIVVDLHAGESPLTGSTPHHQSYATNENSGAI